MKRKNIIKEEKKENVKIQIKEEQIQAKQIQAEQIKKPFIVKKQSGIYHDEHGKLLYKPDEEYELKSCCGKSCSTDKSFLEFLSKFLISSSVLTFSMYQLAINNGDTSYFASTISLILGVYINSTQQKNKEK